MKKPDTWKMKFLWLRKFLWLILYTLFNLWFMIFNWQMFTAMININLGFTVVRMPPFIALFLGGWIILAIQSYTGYVNRLQRIIRELNRELDGHRKVHTKKRESTQASNTKQDPDKGVAPYSNGRIEIKEDERAGS